MARRGEAKFNQTASSASPSPPCSLSYYSFTRRPKYAVRCIQLEFNLRLTRQHNIKRISIRKLLKHLLAILVVNTVETLAPIVGNEATQRAPCPAEDNPVVTNFNHGRLTHSKVENLDGCKTKKPRSNNDSQEDSGISSSAYHFLANVEGMARR